MSEKKFVGICGSLRKNSRNMGMLRCASDVMPEGTALEIVDITEIPLYREDIPKPDSVKLLAEKVREADGLVLAVAEYNYSYAPALKNALDWLSREKGELLAGKTCAMMGAAGRLNRRVACGMFAAWILTFPACGILAFFLTKLFLLFPF